MSHLYPHLRDCLWVGHHCEGGAAGVATMVELSPVILVFAASILYARGWARARRHGSATLGVTQISVFGLSMALLIAGVVAPLDEMIGASLAAHMLEHEIFVLVPLLLLMARAGTMIMVGLAPDARGSIARRVRSWSGRFSRLQRRDLGWMVLVGVLALWHVPALFDLAIESPVVHGIEHGSFFVAAFVYWSGIVGGSRRRRRDHGGALVSLFTVMLLGTAAGAIITFARTPIYPVHASLAGEAGLDWLTDQRLAGLLMWIPPGVLFLGLFTWLAHSWLSSVDTRQIGREVPS